jgi:hypothetical protein
VEHFGKNSPKLNRKNLVKIHQIRSGVRGGLRYDIAPAVTGEGGDMLLQCETGSGAGEAAPAAAWLDRETLESLAELNELCLALLAEQAAARGSSAGGLLRQVAELWHVLDDAARRRAASCPYLLLDAGFGDPLRWRPPPAPQVGDGGHRGPGAYASFFTVPAAVGVARLVFIYAWHLARSRQAAARLLLAMPAASAVLIRHYTLRQIEALAESHVEWLRPRWPSRVQAWRELLLAAASGEMPALERARLRGLTLLAAEAQFFPQAPGTEAP